MKNIDFIELNCIQSLLQALEVPFPHLDGTVASATSARVNKLAECDGSISCSEWFLVTPKESSLEAHWSSWKYLCQKLNLSSST
eukprot:6490766-Amphidinium_carterae.1